MASPYSVNTTRPSILSTILRVESGGHNIPQGIHDINTEHGTPAQGYFQIIDPTWMRYGGGATGYKSAIDAPWEVQRNIALNIPIGQWGPNTQAALRNLGYTYAGKATLGDVLKQYGEDPNATTPDTVGKERAQQQGPTKGGAPLTGNGPVATAAPAVAAAAAGQTDQDKYAQAAQDVAGGLGHAFGAGQQQPAMAKFAAPQFSTIGGQVMPMVAEHPIDAARRDQFARLMQSYGIT